MPIVEVSIRGKRYPISCEAGQEEELRALGEKFDQRVSGLAQALPRAGDMALLVIAGIMAEADTQEGHAAPVAAPPPLAEDVHAQKEAMKKVEEKALENANQTLSRAINGIADYVENVAKTLESV